MKNSTKFYFLIVLTTLINEAYAQPFKTEKEWKNYFQANILILKEYEGIWDVKAAPMLKYLDGEIKSTDWVSSPICYLVWKNDRYYTYNEKGEQHYFMPTADENILLYRDNIFDTNHDHRCSVSDGTSIAFQYNWGNFSEEYQAYVGLKESFLKLYPTQSDIESAINNAPQNKGIVSGTGFAVSSNGYLITNCHVIDEGNSISIKGVKGDFNKSLSAKVVVKDKANDLALLKITDENFKGTGVIPYAFSFKNAQVGNNVYALGYPLRATMGDEVKLTNGIISANSGFEGAINQYQISVPVQPGNSGGPLISSAGNIVGVVNSKHTGTENVSYAIKGSFLTNLIESSGENIVLPQTNILTGKPLSEQVLLVKKFVYIIEVE